MKRKATIDSEKQVNEISKSNKKTKKSAVNQKTKILETNKNITQYLIKSENDLIPAKKNQNKSKSPTRSDCSKRVKDMKINNFSCGKKKIDQNLKKQFFDEDFILEIQNLLQNYLNLLEENMSRLDDNESDSNSSCKDFRAFSKQNLSNFLVKFFLQLSDDYFFLPKSFEDLDGFENQKMKLFNGFNSEKFIILQYQPINSNEIIDRKVSESFKKYIENFKPNGKHKGFLIFDHNLDFNENVALIEAICNEFHYKILRIDELESQKATKLGKISEACKSQRISTINDSINDKTCFLQNVIFQNESNETNSNLFSINSEDLKENTNSINNSSEESNLNSLQITRKSNKSYENSERKPKIESNLEVHKKFDKKIIENILNISSSQRTLILIFENFANLDEDRTFFKVLSNNVSISKAPIVVITDSLSRLNPDNLNSFFKYFKVVQKDLVYEKTMIFHFSIIVFLEFSLRKLLLNVLNENKNCRFDLIKTFLSENKSILEEEFTPDHFKNLVNFVKELCYMFSFNFVQICHFIKMFQRFKIKILQHKNYFEIIMKSLRKIYFENKNIDNFSEFFYKEFNFQEEKINEDNFENEENLKSILKYSENLSFTDYFDSKINKLCLNETRNSEKEYEFKFKENKENHLTTKNGKIQIQKNNETSLIHCEEARFYYLFQNELHYLEKSDNYLEITSGIKNFDLVNSLIQHERNNLLRKSFPLFLNSENSYEFSYFFNEILNLDKEKFDRVLGCRRRTRNQNKLDNSTKVNALLRFFNKKLLSREQLLIAGKFFHFEFIFKRINQKFYLDHKDTYFFTKNKITREISSFS